MATEQALRRAMAGMLAGDPGAQAPDASAVHAWRLIRWEADASLTEKQRDVMLAGVESTFAPAGTAAALFSADGDVMTIMLALERFPARVHRDTVLWLCVRGLMEHASVRLEQEGTVFIGGEFAHAGDWMAHLAPMEEISRWWQAASPIGEDAAAVHLSRLQESVRRRQYAVLGGYVSRALRTETEPGRVCFGFVPLVVEAVWSQHGELALAHVTGGLNLAEMPRRPRETLLAWLTTLQRVLRACPPPANTAPIDRVIGQIRADCAQPYSQASLASALGMSPACFCRLFRQRTGQHFSTFLTRARMEKAQYLLSDGFKRSLAQVSADCGYPNKSYFCQVFKKYTGMTPGEFESTYQDV